MQQDLIEIVRATWWWLLPGVLVAGFFGLLFSLAVMERRLVRPYVPAVRRSTLAREFGQPLPLDYSDETPDPSQASPYVAMMSKALFGHGFEFGGFAAHAKAPRIRILATMWWTPSRTIIALTGSGTVMKMPAYQTWLFSPLANGRFIVTTDNTDEGDSSGLYIIKRVINGTMDALLSKHAERIEQSGDQVEAFAESTTIEAIFGIYQARVTRLIERGLARYADVEQSAWYYSPKGGLWVCLGFFTQLATALSQIVRRGGGPIAATSFMPIGRDLLPVEQLEGLLTSGQRPNSGQSLKSEQS